MSFVKKNLVISFSLATGSFSGGGNSLTLSGLRATAEISSVPGQNGSSLDELLIYGMSLSQMNQLSVTGTQLGSTQQNEVTVQAEDGYQPTTVFQGTVLQAYVDARDMPNVRFFVTAKPGGYDARKPVSPTTQQGATKAQSLAQQIAGQMGMQFENNGVDVTLMNPYLWGTNISKLRQLARSAYFEWNIDRGKVAIWPKGGSRGGSTLLISPQTGMIGYPVFNQARIFVSTYFNPAITPNGQIQVQSSLTAACGTWTIAQMSTLLDANTPHGRWESTLTCDNPNAVPSSGNQ